MPDNMMSLYGLNHTRAHDVTLTGALIEAEQTVHAPLGRLELAGVSWQEQAEASKNLFDPSPAWLQGSTVNGDLQYFTTRLSSDKITLQGGGTYTIKLNDTSLGVVAIAFFANDEFVNNKVVQANPATFTLPPTATKVSIIVRKTAETPITPAAMQGVEIMLNTGSTATPYEPYRPASPSPDNPSPILSLDNPVLTIVNNALPNMRIAPGSHTADTLPSCERYHSSTIPIPYTLRGISDGAGGWIARDHLTTDQQHAVHTQAIARKELDGTEPWVMHVPGSGQGANSFRLTIPGKEAQYKATACTHFKNISDYGVFAAGKAPHGALTDYPSGISNIYVAYGPSTITVDAFKNWLSAQKAAGTPVVLYYQLANPTTDDITNTPTGQQLLQATSYYPSTVIHATAANALQGGITAQVKVIGN